VDDFLEGLTAGAGPVIEPRHSQREPVRKSRVPRLSREDINDLLAGSAASPSDDWDW
jgi:hypothetical protein